MVRTLRETDLFAPLRDYLAVRGYVVRGEVRHCDVTAIKGNDLIVIELKRHLGLDLLIQATARQRVTDSVYVAVPSTALSGESNRRRGAIRVLRQLELGLILVHFGACPPRVEIAFHPLPYQRRKRASARRAVIEEIAQRSGEFNVGGSTRRKLVTAYRENAIHVACCLERLGPSAPRALRALGTGPKTLSILYSNVYGWFDRVDKGTYALAAEGRAALDTYADIAAHYRNRIAETAEGRL